MKNKKLTQKQIDKRHKILTIVKWVGVGLGWSILLTGFIGLLVIGIRGCSNKTSTPPKTNITTPVNRHIGEPNNITTGSVSMAYADTYYYAGFNATQVRDLDRDYDTSYQVGGFINDSEYYFITCKATMTPGQKYFRIRFWTSDTTYLEQFSIATDNGAMIINGDFNLGDLIVLNENVNNGYPLTWWLYHATYNYQNYGVDFNDQINYYSPIGTGLDFFAPGQYAGAYPLFRGLFTDIEGNTYKELGISYLGGVGTAYGTGGSDYHVNQNEDTSQYMFLYYRRFIDNTMIVVNAVDYYTCTSSSHEGATTLSMSSHWTSAIFQHINVVYAYENQWDNELGHYDTLPSSKNLTRRQVLSSFNNLNNSTGIVDGNNIGNGLTLVGNAFSSLTGIFGIYVLPGITFGVLLFIPLLVGITLAILKLLRK